MHSHRRQRSQARLRAPSVAFLVAERGTSPAWPHPNCFGLEMLPLSLILAKYPHQTLVEAQAKPRVPLVPAMLLALPLVRLRVQLLAHLALAKPEASEDLLAEVSHIHLVAGLHQAWLLVLALAWALSHVGAVSTHLEVALGLPGEVRRRHGQRPLAQGILVEAHANSQHVDNQVVACLVGRVLGSLAAPWGFRPSVQSVFGGHHALGHTCTLEVASAPESASGKAQKGSRQVVAVLPSLRGKASLPASRYTGLRAAQVWVARPICCHLCDVFCGGACGGACGCGCGCELWNYWPCHHFCAAYASATSSCSCGLVRSATLTCCKKPWSASAVRTPSGSLTSRVKRCCHLQLPLLLLPRHLLQATDSWQEVPSLKLLRPPWAVEGVQWRSEVALLG